MDSLICYVLGLILLVISSIILLDVLLGATYFGNYAEGIASTLALVGGTLFFCAAGRIIYEQLHLFVGRIGSERPLTLARDEAGHWIKDPYHGFSVYPLVGEVEYERESEELEQHIANDSLDLFSCGCLSGTIELASMAFGNGKHHKRETDSDP